MSSVIKLMHLKYIFIFLWALSVLPTLCAAQQPLLLKDTVIAPEIQQLYPRYRLIQWGLSVNTLRDGALSPLLYQGAGSQWILQYWKYKDQKVLVQNTFSTSSATYVNMANDNVIASFDLGYQHTRLYPVSLRNDQLQLYLGGFVYPFFCIKLLPGNINNVVSYEFLGSLGVSGLLQYPLELFHGKCILSEQLSLPVLAILLRPPYAWPVPTAVEEGGSLASDLQTGTWNRYFSLTNQISLNFYTRKKRHGQVVKKVSQQLSYIWNYYAIPHPNLLQTASHTITYSRVLKID